MGKLKNLFSNLSEQVKETFKKFPITMVIIYITTMIFVFCTDDFTEKFIDDMWFAVMAIWGIGTIFTETFFNKKYIKAIGGAISLIIALMFRNILNDEIYSKNYMIEKFIITYVLVLPFITIYKLVKDSGLELKEYALKALSNFGKNTTIYVLANIGIVIVSLVFIELILDGDSYDILPRTLILLLGGFYIPSLLDSITEMKVQVGKFIKVLLTYILMPVAMFLITILYLYVIKIILKGELLKNALFFILSLTFSLAIPCVILLKNYSESKAVSVMSNVLLYAFIPLLFLQIYSMNVRVKDYGLTEARYAGYLLIAFEIIFISLMIIKKSKYLDKTILVLIGFVILGIISPLNIFDVSVYSQTARITNMLKKVDSFEKLSVEEKNECKKAFVYVDRSIKPEYLDRKLTKEEKIAIDEYAIEYKGDSWSTDREYDYISVYNQKTEVDIEGFKKLYESPYNSCSDEEGIDLKNYEIKDREEKIQTTVNLEKFVEEMIKADKEHTKDAKFENMRYIQTNNANVVFYITDFSISYEVYSKTLENISIDGYLLVK